MTSLKLAFIGTAFLPLAGCVSLIAGPDTPDALYRIDSALKKAELSATLTIREPEAPMILAGDAIVSEDATGAMRLVPKVEWAGRSTRLFQMALADSFTAGEAGSAVLPSVGAIADMQLSTRFQEFGLKGNEAHCQVVARLITIGGEISAQARIKEYVMAADDDANSRALAMKQAAERCVASTVTFAVENLGD